MNKREALEVLIQHSFIFTEGERQQLLAKAGTMSDETVENLGKFLALEKKHAIEKNQTRFDSIPH